MANYTTTGSDTFPAGHVIKHKVKAIKDTTNIITSGTSYNDSGIELIHTTAKNMLAGITYMQIFAPTASILSSTLPLARAVRCLLMTPIFTGRSFYCANTV